MAALLQDYEAAEDQSAITDRIAGYVLTRRLGEGGSGVVYLGYRQGSDRPLAIKLMRRLVGGSEHTNERKRAWRELEMLTQLRLPALPRVIDYGLQDGRLYLAVEFVDGQPLVEFCQNHDLDRRARVALLARVADAVQSLHDHGVLHRDLKPSNILVDRAGDPVIVDLGIATTITGNLFETLTTEGVPIGSPAFMSPEQARGERAVVSIASDVFGLGATAAYLLTGKTPHDTETTVHEAVRRVAQDPARPLRTLDPAMPRALAAVLDKAVAHEPADRYGSAADFAAELRRWLAGRRVEARRRWWAPRVGPGLRRFVVLGAIVSLTAGVGLVGGLTWSRAPAPAAIETDAWDSSWVRLVSAEGRVLHAWEADGGGIAGAQLLREPTTDGPGLVLIGYGAAAPAALRGRLCAYSAADPARLLWARGISTEKNAAPGTFSIETFLTADVFDDVAGPEIVAVYSSQALGRGVVRVYGQGGGVLDEVWHEGPLSRVVWLSEPKLLVACGLKSQKSASAPSHVVFAFTPREGRSGAVIGEGAGSLQPAWYRYVVPPAGEDLSREPMSLSLPEGDLDPSEFVRVSIGAGPAGPRAAWIVSPTGQVTQSLRERDREGSKPNRPGPRLAPAVEAERRVPLNAPAPILKTGRTIIDTLGRHPR